MAAALDVERLRRETPGVGHGIHLNSAGASLMPAPVVAALQAHLALEAELGAHEAMARRAAALAAVYDSLARLLGAPAGSIALTESATVGWQRIVYGLAFAPGDRLLIAGAEYGSNAIALADIAARTGAAVEVMPADRYGAVDVEALGARIDARVKLVALSWIPTNGGLVEPAAAVGRLARAHAIPYLVDATQAVGHIPVDVGEVGCDFLTGAGRKWLRGPRGTGFLYARPGSERLFRPAVADQWSATWRRGGGFAFREDARRYESFEHAPGLRLGLGAAVDYALALGISGIRERIFALAGLLRSGLAAMPGIEVTDLGREQAGLVTFRHARRSASEIRAALAAEGIRIGVSLPEHAPWDAEARRLPELARLSAHCFVSEAEIVRCLERIERL